ncbi:non-ribosomal peptide synthetase [uncultured Kordia sp.]|uniref:non-ribosomal peptide synthetase n=1 Tax=uncultured Kordia sp. TaxID=507699 RepID=UPI002638D7C8|nr:non-ribosomal peptide synthetase [uncultured Kordia sp.]
MLEKNSHFVDENNLDANTLVSYLKRNAHYSEKGITFISAADSEEFLSYKDLYQKALFCLYNLQSKGIEKGDEVVFQINDNRSFMILFWACLLGRIIPVPLTVGNRHDHKLKFIKVWNILHNPYLVCEEEIFNKLKGDTSVETSDIIFSEQLDERYLLVKDILQEKEEGIEYSSSPEDLAYIQFSSGSTGDPKGVMLTHSNLVYNASDIVLRSETTSNDRMLSWMPLTHDMGLICFHLSGILASIHQYIMPAGLFVRRPVLWIEKANEHKATQLYSPNFGYHFFLSAFKGKENVDWDISSIRIIYNGAEPISHELCEEFAETLAPYGLKNNTMFPGYGLAEASVAVALPNVGDELVVYQLDRNHLNTGDHIQILDGAATNETVSFVQNGYPIKNCAIQICDEYDNVLDEGYIGHIQIKGKNVTAGYYNNQEKTNDIITSDQWLKTGDLGFFDQGRIVITGRAKNIIIINGQNYYPHDIERVIGEKLPEFDLGKTVACGIKNDEGYEKLVVFVLFKKKLEDFITHVQSIKKMVLESIGLEVSEVIAIRKIPRTTSGKIQNFKLIQRYGEGAFLEQLNDIEHLLYVEANKALSENLSTEEKLLHIWNELFDNNHIELTDNIFDTGLNSIAATRFSNRIQELLGVQVSLKDLFTNPTLNELVAHIHKANTEQAIPKIEKTATFLYYPTSFAQRRFWLLQQFEENYAAYNLVSAYKIEGNIDVNALEKTFIQIINAYEILRTTFIEINDRLVQKVQAKEDFSFTIDQIQLNGSNNIERLVEERLRKEAIKQFDLENGPLLRVGIMNVNGEQSYITFTIHHIITDGWSMGILTKQIQELYSANLHNQNTIKLAPSLQYKDYAVWQKQVLATEAIVPSRTFWHTELKEELPLLSLPFSKSRPLIQTFNGAEVSFNFSSDFTAELEQFCQKESVTIFMTLLSSLNILLHRYTGANDIIIGTDTAGRNQTELEDQIGYFLNTLPLRLSINSDDHFNTLLAKAKQKVLDAFTHQAYPFDQLVDELDLRKDLGRTPVFDVLLLFQNFEDSFYLNDLSEANIQAIKTETNHSITDLEFEFFYENSELSCKLKYNTDLFEHENISRMAVHFKELLKQVIQEPSIEIGEYDYLSMEEKQQLQSFETAEVRETSMSVIERFEAQAEKNANAIALVFEGKQWTYGELNTKVNQFAAYLTQQPFYKAESKIGVYIQRSEWQIITILAILKTGGCYVPVDPETPMARTAYMLENAKADCVITDIDFEDNQGSLNIALLSLNEAKATLNKYEGENLGLPISDTQLAYILYTSGTTGMPKGVMINHAALNDYITTFTAYFTLSSQDKILQQSSLAFDVSVEEIFPILCAGGELFLMKEGGRDIDEVTSVIQQNDITILSTTPLIINELNKKSDYLTSLRILISGGDKLKARYIDQLIDQVAIFNTYGPTEATVCVTYHRIKETSEIDIIGKPLPNHKIHVLDTNMRPVPVGISGELYVEGIGLAEGYVNSEAETAKAFQKHPQISEGRLYKTGDTGMWLADGTIKFLGRTDTQLKIRGYRIELGEIEKTLLLHKEISDAIIRVVTTEEEKYLVAYIESQNKIENEAIKAHLENSLPHYMIPRGYIMLDKFPVNNNGKIDKTKLFKTTWDEVVGAREAITPSNEIEEKLLRIWKEVLDKETLGVTDNFFEIGGQSLKATQIISRITKTFGVKLSMLEVFKYPTIRSFSQNCIHNSDTHEAAHNIPKAAIKDFYPLSYGQKRMWILSQFEDQHAAFNLSWTFKLTGNAIEKHFEKAIKTIVERHESLRTSFVVTEGEPLLKIENSADITLPIEYISSIDALEADWQKMASENAKKPFNLEEAPLFRITLIQEKNQSYTVQFTIHHIISDGWSIDVFSNELIGLINASKREEEHTLQPLSIQYTDFVFWQQHQLTEAQGITDANYWHNRFKGEIPVLSLPTYQPRPSVMTSEGNTLSYKLEDDIMEGLQKISENQQGSLYMALLSVLKLLFYRYTNQTDIILGSPMAGRNHDDLENQLGYYLNVLPLRTTFSENDNFLELFETTKETVLEALEHQFYPIDKLIEELDLKRDTSRSPLFDVLVVLQNFDNKFLEKSKGTHEVAIEAIKEVDNGTSINDLLIEFNQFEGYWSVKIRYNTQLFTEGQMTRLFHHFETLAKQVIAQSELKLHEYEFITKEEKNELLDQFGNTITNTTDFNIIAAFDNQVRINPTNIAVKTSEDHALTYIELAQRVDKLATYLSKEVGIQQGDFIGIVSERSEKLIISILAVLKVGATFIPIDPDYPAKRIEKIIDSSHLKVIITDTWSADEIQNDTLQILREDVAHNYKAENLSITIQKDELAYIMYTSGSTGEPKGVMISRFSLNDYVKTFIDYYDLTATDKVIQQSSIGFDVAIEEIFPALCVGACILISKEGGKDIKGLAELIEQHGATVLSTTPLVINELNQELDKLGKLRILISGGEALRPEQINRLIHKVAIYNTYGPTEVTVCATFQKITSLHDVNIIGTPITNHKIYLFDEHMNLVPQGVEGEIYVVGNGLAQGYLNLNDETKKRFITNPLQTSEKMYRTGDIGKWMEDGTLKFLGRNDEQIKIRGYRVELAEIQKTLFEYEALHESFVTTLRDNEGELNIVLFYLSTTDVDHLKLQGWLSQRLPGYMVPTYVHKLEKIPRNSNGKIDTKKLPSLLEIQEKTTVAIVLPKNKVQKQFFNLWAEILEKTDFGIHDNFFALGGNSIKAMRIMAKAAKEMNLKVKLSELFNNPTIDLLSKAVSDISTLEEKEITPIPLSEYYELSNAQKRLWILDQFNEEKHAYNIFWSCKLYGKIDVEIFNKSFQSVIDRHESFRTNFVVVDELPKQKITPKEEVDYKINYRDLSAVQNIEQEIAAIIEEEQKRTFNLAEGSLMNVQLLQINAEEHILLLNIHHIISDGWSVNVLVNELKTLYNAYSEGKPNPLSKLQIQYKDYVAFLNKQLAASSIDVHKEYWLEKFSGELPVLNITTDFPRPPIKTVNGHIQRVVLTEDKVAELRTLGEQQGASLFMIFLGALKVLLFRYTGQQDLIVGSPVAGRNVAGLDDQIGFYVNTLAMRTTIHPEFSFCEVLEKVKETALEAYEHQIYPFDTLVEELKLERDLARSPLFDVMIAMQSNTLNSDELAEVEGIKIDSYPVNSCVSKFDFNFNFVETATGFELELEYNTDIFSAQRVERLLSHYQNILAEVAQNPSVLVREVTYISAQEKNKLTTSNSTNIEFNKSVTIQELIEQQAQQTPHEIAVLFDDNSITYEELNKASDAIAHQLIFEHHVKPNDLVGVLMDRSEKMVIALLGILKSGAAYVPIDPNYPQKRIEFILKDSAVKTAITLDKYRSYFDKNVSCILLDALTHDAPYFEKPTYDVTHTAYVIYTSGSTGLPKGVLITHKNVLALVYWAQEEFKNDNFDIVFSATSYCFDLSVFELFFTLTVGKKIRVLQSGLDIKTHVTSEKNILINTVPSVVENLVKENTNLDNVTVLNMAGEPIPLALKANLDCDAMKVRNLYGPSEDTTYSSCYQLKTDDINIPIGKPIHNTRFYIVDEHLNLVPEGTVGELCISGDGLAKGYLNREALTLDKFIENPFEKGQRLYKTGDLGKLLPDGNMEFLGRKDNQVKIRGFRIEIGEIEQLLSNYSQIETVLVVAHKEKTGEHQLAAYFTATKTIHTTALYEYLKGILPAYMLPSFYIQLDEFPQTPNGKIDRKALPTPENSNTSTSSKTVKPQTETEEKVLEIWLDILQKETISITDNFFMIGGHSLKATQIILRINKAFSIDLQLKDFFMSATIAELSKVIDAFGKIPFDDIQKTIEQDFYEVSNAQQRLWVLDQLEPNSHVYNMPSAYMITGNLNLKAFKDAYKTLVERHESLRTVFVSENGEPKQTILDYTESKFSVEVETLTIEDTIELKIQEEAKKPFDLVNGPLFRLKLIPLKDDRHVFLFTIHHIISDGWSMDVILKEIIALYDAYNHGKENPLPQLSIQYKDYAAWQRKGLYEGKYKQQKQYWKHIFKDEVAALKLPNDRKRPIQKTYNGSSFTTTLENTLVQKIDTFRKAHNASLFMVFMASVKALLYKYSKQEDIVVGIPIAGRPVLTLQDQIGFYTNTLAIRTTFSESDTFAEVLETEKRNLLDAFANQDYPFDELIEELNIKRDLQRSPLFDVMVVFNEANTNKVLQSNVKDLDIEELTIPTAQSKYDLVITFHLEDEKVTLHIDYNTDLYTIERIVQISNHYKELVNGLTTSENESLKSVAYLPKEEKNILLDTFNQTKKFNITKTVVELFEEQVLKTPHAIAVASEGKELTYSELNAKSNRLARFIRKNYDITDDSLIGLMLDRSTALMVGIWGILKAGAGYVPIDPSYPTNRKMFLIEDSDIHFVLTEQKYIDDINFDKIEAINTAKIEAESEENLSINYNLNGLIYSIYTSGTTGKPKGVLVAHHSVVNLCLWLKDIMYDSYAAPRTLLTASYSFDSSVKQLFPPFLSGGTLVIPSEEKRKDPALLLKEIFTNKINIFDATPSYLSHLLNEVAQGNYNLNHTPDFVLIGGEIVHADLARRYHKIFGSDTEILNVYGVTEATVDSSWAIASEHLEKDIIPIGKPLPGTKMYICDETLNLQPIGVEGELYIGGEGVSRGYHNRPALTKEKFIESPFVKGDRLYKTGDMAKWLPDGNMLFLGRIDNQVKIRGHRIELGEIENTIAEYDTIVDVSVIVKNEQDEQYLIAYITSSEAVEATQLRTYLKGHLPTYMLPDMFIQLDKLPLSSHGKVDKKALLSMTTEMPQDGITKQPSRNITEKILSQLWSKLLKRENIGITENFFEIGGHSLRAIQLTSFIHREFNVKIGLKDVFKYPTIQSLSEVIHTSKRIKLGEIQTVPFNDVYDLSYAQKRLWILDQKENNVVAYNISGAYKIKGLDVETFEKVFQSIVARHETLRTTFVMHEGEPKQRIAKVEEVDFRIKHIHLKNTDAQDDKVIQIAEDESNTYFDLQNDTLIRATLLHLQNDTYVFILTLHHIISDGWSIGVLVKDVVTLYEAHQNEEESTLAPLKIQYKDYANWQNTKLEKGDFTAHQKYWSEKLKGELPVLQLDQDFIDDETKTYQGHTLAYDIDVALSEQIYELAKAEKATVFMVLLTFVKALLHKYSKQEDIIIGSLVAGREHPDLEDQIGFYLNTLPLRTRFSADESVGNLLEKVKNTMLEAYEYQTYPFDKIVDDVSLNKVAKNKSLFNVLVSLQNFRDKDYSYTIDGNSIEHIPVASNTSKFDISFYFFEKGEQIFFEIEYNTDLYKHERIELMAHEFLFLSKKIVGDLTQKLSDIQVKSDWELELDQENQLKDTNFEFNF